MRGGEVVTRLAHNQEIVGSNPTPANQPMKLHTTNYKKQIEAAMEYMITKENNKNTSIIKGLFVIVSVAIILFVLLFFTMPLPK